MSSQEWLSGCKHLLSKIHRNKVFSCVRFHTFSMWSYFSIYYGLQDHVKYFSICCEKHGLQDHVKAFLLLLWEACVTGPCESISPFAVRSMGYRTMWKYFSICCEKHGFQDHAKVFLLLLWEAWVTGPCQSISPFAMKSMGYKIIWRPILFENTMCAF